MRFFKFPKAAVVLAVITAILLPAAVFADGEHTNPTKDDYVLYGPSDVELVIGGRDYKMPLYLASPPPTEPPSTPTTAPVLDISTDLAGVTIVKDWGSATPDADTLYLVTFDMSDTAQPGTGKISITFDGAEVAHRHIAIVSKPERVVAEAASASESDGTGSYDIKLSARPVDGCTVTVTPRQIDEAVRDERGWIVFLSNKDTLTGFSPIPFDSSNWNTPQTVNFSVANDDYDLDRSPRVEHSVAYGSGCSHAKAGQQAVAGDVVTVNIADDDTRGLVLSAASLNVIEGDDVTYTVKLSSKPYYDDSVVDVRPNIDPEPPYNAEPGILRFTADNWNVAQTVTITVQDDNHANTPSGILSHRVSGSGYTELNDVENPELEVTVTDNDTVELVISDSAVRNETSVLAVVYYTIALATKPQSPGDVVVTATLTSGKEFRGRTQQTVTFKADRWSSPQRTSWLIYKEPATLQHTVQHTHTDPDTDTTTNGEYHGITVPVYTLYE